MQPNAVCIDVSLQAYGQKRGEDFCQLHGRLSALKAPPSSHIGTRPGLMQRKVEPSRPGVKTLPDIHMHLFTSRCSIRAA